jgi:hypothetical protein
MVKKKAKKKASPLDKIKKELAKLEKLHEKENDVVENISYIIDAEADEDREWH